MNVLIIGGGPAGMMAAITAAENQNDVTIIEKNNECGKKLLITGKGRCNVTNAVEMEDFYKNIPGNSKFLYSSFNTFTNQDIIKFLHEQGVKTKVERGNRVFPESDNSRDVLNAFISKLKSLNVKVKTNCEVEKIIISENKEVKAVELSSGKQIDCDKVILATGGASYPVTGSTGDGYKIAKSLGHTIIQPKPALVPLKCEEEKSLNICKRLQGLSLRNVKIKLVDENKIIYEDFGEMLFTHFGVSGPIILSASSVLLRYKDVENLLKNDKIKLQIDLKPALDNEKLDNRILRDFEELKNKQYKNSLNKLLPQKMIDIIVELTKINPEKKVNEITKEERKKIVQILKCMEITINGFGSINEAIVTAGGVSIKEINPKTMQSKIIKGLYFAGEIIDVDALTGGFNLQIAYSTGVSSGKD